MIYLNDRLVSPSEALISVYDHGFLYGDGIYETLRAYEGVIFKVDEHIERLFRSAALIKLTISKTNEEIKAALYETLLQNSLKNAYIRVTLSRGYGPIGLDPSLCKTPTFVIFANPFEGHPKEKYEKGISIILAQTRRNYDRALNPQIKSLNFLNNILAKTEALSCGAAEAVMLNYQDFLTEGSISNIFFVLNGIVATPSVETGILDGITRRMLIHCTKEKKFPLLQGFFTKQNLYEASEIFLTNTSMEVMPVSQIDGRAVKSCPGMYTKALHKHYKKHVRDYIEKNI
jgi:branched-chain amino acid aminotransferase